MERKLVRVSDVMRTTVHMVSGLSNVRDAISEMSRHNVSSLVIDRHEVEMADLVDVRVDDQEADLEVAGRIAELVDSRLFEQVECDRSRLDSVCRADLRGDGVESFLSAGDHRDVHALLAELPSELLPYGRARTDDERPGAIEILIHHDDDTGTTIVPR